MTTMVREWTVHSDKMRAACEDGFLVATDLADYLVMQCNLPFREAHHITGAAVKLAADQNKNLSELSLAELQTLHVGITENVFAILLVEGSLNCRQSAGGTAPVRVREAIAAAKQALS
jgi:argininosuccinate lyase